MPVALFSMPCAKRCARSEPPSARRRSIPSCSLPPSTHNMKAISGGKRSTPRYSRWRRTTCRSKRSCVVSVTAGSLSAGSFEESGKTSFAPGRVPWSGTSLGSMHSGRRDVAMARTSGGASKDKGFEVLSGWSPSGQPGGDAQRELMLKTSNASLHHAPSRA